MRRTRARGYALVLAIMLSTALVFLALVSVNLYRSESAVASQSERALVAAEAASAGLEAAFAQLKANPAWSAGFSQVELPNSRAVYHVTFNRGQSTWAWSTNNSTGTAELAGWDGRAVPAGTIHLVAVGTFAGARQVAEALVQASSAAVATPMFGYTEGGIVGARALVDSYNSKVGPYPSSLVSGGPTLGTNSISNGVISLQSGSVVNGKVRVGPGGTAAAVTGTGTYQGLEVPAAPFPVLLIYAPFSFSNRDVRVSGTVTLAPGAYQDLQGGSGSKLVLTAGTYVFKRLMSDANFEIQVQSGPVRVFFTHLAKFGAANRLNVAGPPENLAFNGDRNGGARDFSLGDGTVGRFTVTAPLARFELGKDSEIFGSVLSRGFTIGDRSKVHLDQPLAEGSAGFTVLSRW